MAEYIEREALLDDLRGSYEELRNIYNGLRFDEERRICSAELNSFMECIIRVQNVPTADVVEVRHGEWIVNGDDVVGEYYTCSVCKCDWTTIDGTPAENNMRYCPECGAKMDGKGEGE